MHKLSILGSTGSIGVQTLEIVRKHPDLFRVAAIAANKNVDLIVKQAEEFEPELISIADESAASQVRSRLGKKFRIEVGESAALEAAKYDQVNLVVAGIVGFSGLESTIAAIKSGKTILLANKESLVSAGELVRKELPKSSAKIIPIDSEHNSIHQCLKNSDIDSEVKRIILTASGGPFFFKSPTELENVSVADALQHPTWKMGAKVTIDSATLMNKGLEIIEAYYLFSVDSSKIEYIIHPQSIIHGLVEFNDSSTLAAMYNSDMKVPISHALAEATGRNRISLNKEKLNLFEKKLEFYEPDENKFPAPRLCYQALETGGLAPAVLNAANEIAVQAFLEERISFQKICQISAQTLENFKDLSRDANSLEEIIETDSLSRKISSEIISKIG